MTEANQGVTSCRNISWIAAAVLGLLTVLCAMWVYEWAFIWALIAGIVVFAVLGWLFVRLFCSEGQTAPYEGARGTDASAAQGSAAPGGAAPATGTGGAGVSAAKDGEAPAAGGAGAGSDRAATEDDAASGNSSGRDAGMPEADAADGEMAGTDASAGDRVPRVAVTAGAAAAAAATAASAEGSRPAGLDGPRGGKADDLKQIKGIGPGLERMLNGMGIYHFDQIAAWTPEEVAYMDANMPRFKGRASRDDWVGQARTLAAGGETEFASRVKSGEVYD